MCIHTAVWDDENHSLVTDEQWEKMLNIEEAEGNDGCCYGNEDNYDEDNTA